MKKNKKSATTNNTGASENCVYRPYTATLLPNARKKQMLKDTYDILKKGQNVFFETFLTITGGINRSTVQDLIDSGEITNENEDVNENEKNKPIDTQLLCATVWFKLVNRKGEVLTGKEMIRRFNKYYGEEANDAVKTYLNNTANIEGYIWVDSREEFTQLCQEIGTTKESFDKSVESMMREKDITIYNAKINEVSAISHIFGEGKKSDVAGQYDFCIAMIAALNETECKTFDDYVKVLFKVFGSSSLEEVDEKWRGGAGGRSATVMNYLKKESYNDFTHETVKKDWEEIKKKKSFTPNRDNVKVFKAYIEKEIGSPYYAEAWEAMYLNALSDICSKITRNYNFTIEQVELKEKIKSYDHTAVQLLNSYFKSSYFKQEHEFVIRKHHLPNLEKMIKLYSELKVIDEEHIDQVIENVNKKTKRSGDVEGTAQLQRYVLSICKQVTVEQLKDALEINALEDEFKTKKVNPFVEGNRSFGFGPSALYGGVIPPHTVHKGKISGQNPKMWLDICLYEKDKQIWKIHHVPFYNSKFFEEIYYHNPNLTNMVNIRTKRLKTNIVKNVTREKSSKHKFYKTNIRNTNTIQNCNSNVDMIPSSFQLRKEKRVVMGEEQVVFSITISQHIKKGVKKRELRIGDKVLGYDLNRDRPSTYVIGRITGELKKGRYTVEFEKSGIIQSMVNKNEKESFDVLSYNGIDQNHHAFKQFVKDRTEFAESVFHIDQFKKTPENKMKFDFLLLNELSRIKEKEMYSWNKEYLYLLLRMIKFAKGNIPGIRKEIMETIEIVNKKSSLSPVCITNMRLMKSVINCWFAYQLPEQKATKQQKFEHDKEMYELLEKIEKRRINKNEDKLRKISSSIVAICLQNDVKHVIGEMISSNVRKGQNKSVNNKSSDWCPKKILEKIKTSLEITDINFYGVSPYLTSHRDPLVYDGKEKALGARMAEVNLDDPKDEWIVARFIDMVEHKPREENKLDKAYSDSVDDFCAENEITRHQLQENVNKPIELKDLIKKNKVLIPCRKGDFFLTTHDVTKESKEIKYAGKKKYICDADKVAAANIILQLLAPDERKKKEEKKKKPEKTKV